LLNVTVGDRFYEKLEYLDLSSDQKNTLHLKRVKLGHVPSREGGETMMVERRRQGNPIGSYHIFSMDCFGANPKNVYGTKEMYGTDHSAIFSTQVNNTLYGTQYNV
jgi:hypothetical protein